MADDYATTAVYEEQGMEAYAQGEDMQSTEMGYEIQPVEVSAFGAGDGFAADTVDQNPITAEEHTETTAEQHMETTVEQHMETTTEQHTETTVEQHTETTSEQQVEEPSTNPLPTPSTETVVEPASEGPKVELINTTPPPPPPDSPQAPQTGAVVTGPGGQREQKLYTPAKLSATQLEAVAKAKKYAMEQSIRSVLLKQTIAHQAQLAQMQSIIQRPIAVMGSMQITDQMWTKLGTVYVGGISFDVREDTVKQAFSPFGPIKNVSLSWDAVANKHKGFAFVEYDLPEAAALSIEQMNNVMLGGRTIKMGRPSNMPQLAPILDRLADEARSYNRVYVSSIHPDLVENDVQSVFEAFGKIRSCKLAADMLRPGKHKGYGFVEYETPQAMVDAIASMNLFNLGGQFLRVGRAVTPPNALQNPAFSAPLPTAATLAAAAVAAKMADPFTNVGLTQPLGFATSGLGLATQGLGLSSGFSSLLNPVIPSTGFAPPGIAIPQLAAPVVASLPMPGVVIPQLAPPGVVTPQLTVQQFATTAAPASTVVTGLQAATAAAGKLGLSSGVLTDAQKKLVEDDVGQTLASQENMQISGSQARQMVMQKLLRNTETRVMVLRNMVGPEDVDEELESEVVDECSKYGNVNRVIIYQEKQSEADDAEILVKIFVEFHQPPEVDKAIKALDNRYFAGRLVRAQQFDQAMFDANELSG